MLSSSPASARLLAAWLAPFAGLFTGPTWGRVPVLVEGALLTSHRRTVSAALRATGQDRTPGFARYHRVLNRARWSARAAAEVLLGLLVAAFAPSGPVVIGVDDTLERRWGKRIAARGIYRDPVRSSRGHFVKASGLRWVSLSLLAPIPWADRVWALPFLTVLMWTAGARQRISARLDAPISLTWHRTATARLREAPRVRGPAGIEAAISVGERSGQPHPYVRPVAQRSPLAIMGVRVRVRRQSGSRARGTPP